MPRETRSGAREGIDDLHRHCGTSNLDYNARLAPRNKPRKEKRPVGGPWAATTPWSQKFASCYIHPELCARPAVRKSACLGYRFPRAVPLVVLFGANAARIFRHRGASTRARKAAASNTRAYDLSVLRDSRKLHQMISPRRAASGSNTLGMVVLGRVFPNCPRSCFPECFDVRQAPPHRPAVVWQESEWCSCSAQNVVEWNGHAW